jgi:hypothetical protein
MLFRDERVVVAEWAATSGTHGLPVRFVESGRAELDPAEVRRALASAVDAVVEQLRTVTHPDVAALRADWDTIAETSGEDLVICSRAARLGVDALDPSELTDDLESCLRGALADLPEATGNDVLDAHIREALPLASTVATVRDLVVNGGNAPLRAGARDIGVPVRWQGPAYQVGYAAARALREKHGASDGALDLDALFGSLGLRGAHEEYAPLVAHVAQIQALVGASSAGNPQMFVAPRSRKHARFLQARGLFAIAAGAARDAPRALTSAGARLQVASRAFAAELLAPADLLRARLARGMDDEQVERVAEDLGVATTVIDHQIRNHGLMAGA